MSSFSSSFGQSGHDGYQSFDSQPFESNFSGNESVNEAPEEDVFTSQQAAAPIYSSGGGLSPLSPETSGNGPISPPPKEMEPEEGFALREWRRQNAIRLEEKEKSEKEILKKIVEEADEYKTESYRKWKLWCENNKHQNKEKEKLFLESREKFHAEASKTYWKAIAELIPNEVPAIEKKGKKEKEKKPSIVVIQGPKPGKQTDLTRMRQILVKLKHNAPLHMRPLPIPTASVESGKDSINGTSSPAAGAPAKPASTNPSQALATA